MASLLTPPDGFEPSTDCLEGSFDLVFGIGQKPVTALQTHWYDCVLTKLGPAGPMATW